MSSSFDHDLVCVQARPPRMDPRSGTRLPKPDGYSGMVGHPGSNVDTPNNVTVDRANLTTQSDKLHEFPRAVPTVSQSYVDHYNLVRLHSAIRYVAPQDMLAGRQAEIHAQRDRKLEEARQQRQLRRRTAGTKTISMMAGVAPQA